MSNGEGISLKDTRFIMDNLYKIRRSGNKLFWLNSIQVIADKSPNTRKVEKNSCEKLFEIIRFILKTKGVISYKKIREMIEPVKLEYDDKYICDIEDLCDIVEKYNIEFSKKRNIDKDLVEYMKYVFEI